MKFLLIIIAIGLSACATTPKQYVWDISDDVSPERTAFLQVHKECSDFAYRSKVAGSRFSESDIQTSCIQRKGYSFKEMAVK